MIIVKNDLVTMKVNNTEKLFPITITMMEGLERMDMKQLKYSRDYIDELMEKQVKLFMKVGTKVNVIQKTKKTPGVITKIMNSKCLVDISGRIYRVPMTMLEVA